MSGLDAIAAEVRAWQAETFGPADRRTGCYSRLDHIRREVGEARDAAYLVDRYTEEGANPAWLATARAELAAELADVLILLLSAADEAGVDLAEAVARKHQVNTRRKWGRPDAAGVTEHIEARS